MYYKYRAKLLSISFTGCYGRLGLDSHTKWSVIMR